MGPRYVGKVGVVMRVKRETHVDGNSRLAPVESNACILHVSKIPLKSRIILL